MPRKIPFHSQKHQTRLNFTPLSTSSPIVPASSLLAEASSLKSQAHGVKLTPGEPPSPKKRRRVIDEDSSAAESSPQIPERSRKQNFKLNSNGPRHGIFGSHAKIYTGNLTDSNSDPVTGSERLKHSGHSSDIEQIPLYESDSEAVDDMDSRKSKPAGLATPSSSKPKKRPRSEKASKGKTQSYASTDAPRPGDELESPGRPLTRQRCKDLSNAAQEEQHRIQSKQVRRSGRLRREAPASASEGDPQSGSRRGRSMTRAGANSTVSVEDLDIIGEAETSGDEKMDSSPVKVLKRKGRGMSGRRRGRADWFDIEESDEDESPQRSSKRIRFPRRNEFSSDEDVDNSKMTTPRRSLASSRRSSVHKDLREQEDLEEDLEFLNSSPPALNETSGRLRTLSGTPKQNARKKALELLKQRRAGVKPETSSEEQHVEPASRRRVSAIASSQESDLVSDSAAAAEDDNQDADEPTYRDMFEEDPDDIDFVDNEEEDNLGAPAQLPLAFSRFSSMKSGELFKYAVEWMVQKKINPAFAMEDEVYHITFNKLEDEVKALAGSKFMSSAWTSDFTTALYARPILESHEIPIGSRLDPLNDRCEACNRSGHPATWVVKFTGKPYHHESLEEIADEDEEDSHSEAESYDSKGRPVPDKEKTWSVGRFCMQNATTAHTLRHWRYNLYEWTVDYLRQEGYLTPEKIVERDSWSTNKRRKYANEVVDAMEEKGEIRRLHKDYRLTIDNARNSKQSYQARQRR